MKTQLPTTTPKRTTLTLLALTAMCAIAPVANAAKAAATGPTLFRPPVIRSNVNANPIAIPHGCPTRELLSGQAKCVVIRVRRPRTRFVPARTQCMNPYTHLAVRCG
jgi:hypothetical protein